MSERDVNEYLAALAAAVVKAWSDYAAAHPELAEVVVPLELSADIAVTAVFREQSRLERVRLWGNDATERVPS